MEKIKRPVWALEANLYAPLGDRDIAFGFPAFGPSTYGAAVRQVLDNGQKLPTGEQTAFMLDEVYNSTNPDVKNSPEAQFVRNDIMYPNWLLIPSVNLWTPKDARNPGMYAVFDEAGNGLAKKLDPSELEDRLSRGSTERGVRFSQDRTVAFAPLNAIRQTYHEKRTLAQDGAYIATFGVKGAEKLDRVAKVFRNKPYSWIVDNTTDKPIQTLSALVRVRLVDVDRLSAYFDFSADCRGGYVVSVSGSRLSAEGTAPKN